MPKTSPVYDQLVAVRLTTEQFDELRRQAEIRGWKYSDVIRKALQQWYLDEEKKETLSGAIREGGLPERVRELLR